MPVDAHPQIGKLLSPRGGESNSVRIGFLYQAIADTQSTIRCLDTKAAVALAPLGFMLAKLVEELGTVSFGRHALWWRALALLFGLFSSACAYTALRVFYPQINPCDFVSVPKGLDPAFFVVTVPRGKKRWWAAFVNSKRFEGTFDHAQYSAQVSQATAAQLIQVLAGEVIKLSWIRELKDFRIRWVARLLLYSAVLFAGLLLGRVPPSTTMTLCTNAPVSVAPARDAVESLASPRPKMLSSRGIR